MPQELPAISVVVIGRNEGQRLVRCLESVRAADYPPEKLELIYVDSDSTDDSCAAAEKLGARVIALRPERPTAAAGRNAGLHAAGHDLIQFLDGDTILNPSWLQKGVDAMRDPKLTCVFGRLEEVSPNASIYHFWAHHDWYFPPGRVEACGGVAMFRRSVLLEAGGYDSSLIAGEERDLCHRLIRDHNATILCLDEPMALHDIQMTCFRQYWRRCARTGHARAELACRYGALRDWRTACWREPLHVAAGVFALVLSAGLWACWPVAIWLGLLSLAVTRNGFAVRHRVGALRGAVLYSLHHYLAKLPIAVGECGYWLRLAFNRPPQSLIEHR